MNIWNPFCARDKNDEALAPGEAHWAALREEMTRKQLIERDIRSEPVLAAMRKVPRHQFTPPDLAAHAYKDQPLSIGCDQTISQPYIVAYMTQSLDPKPGDKILEVGTGCGYQAAVLAETGAEVFTVEIIPALAEAAAGRLKALGYASVHVRAGDGFHGWYEEAPFDGILVAAAPLAIPIPLRSQLKVGARMVIPVGGEDQRIKIIVRTSEGYEERDMLDVRFVPMTGEIERDRPSG